MDSAGTAGGDCEDPAGNKLPQTGCQEQVAQVPMYVASASVGQISQYVVEGCLQYAPSFI